MKRGSVIGLISILLLGIVVLFLLKIDNNLNNSTNKQNIQISTSFYPLYYLASEIASDKAKIYNITPAGAEPHDYEPSTKDVANIEDSELLIINGGNLEPWSDNISNILKNTKTNIIKVGEAFANLKTIEEEKTITDPHVWLSPVLAKKEAEIIANKIIEIDPTNKSFYEQNLLALNKKLDNLHLEFLNGLQTCATRDIITSHAAFSYLASEYNLKQIAISGISPDDEPSPKQLIQIAKFAKENQVKYIFFESLLSPELSETIAREVGAKTLVLNPLEGLSDDEIAQGKNYITEMRQNLANLKIALQCQ